MEVDYERILNLIQAGSSDALIEYTSWHAHSAMSLLVIGVLFLIFSVISLISFLENEEDGKSLISFIVLLISVLLIAANYPTVVNPKAYAMHQLIKDVRG
jgi:hypothetical protein